MRFLPQVVKVAVGQLSSFGGNLHGETGGDAAGALLVHQSESLEVPWREHCGDLQEHKKKKLQLSSRRNPVLKNRVRLELRGMLATLKFIHSRGTLEPGRPQCGVRR